MGNIGADAIEQEAGPCSAPSEIDARLGGFAEARLFDEAPMVVAFTD